MCRMCHIFHTEEVVYAAKWMYLSVYHYNIITSGKVGQYYDLQADQAELLLSSFKVLW